MHQFASGSVRIVLGIILVLTLIQRNHLYAPHFSSGTAVDPLGQQEARRGSLVTGGLSAVSEAPISGQVV
jgi:hypothetical protein